MFCCVYVLFLSLLFLLVFLHLALVCLFYLFCCSIERIIICQPVCDVLLACSFGVECDVSTCAGRKECDVSTCAGRKERDVSTRASRKERDVSTHAGRKECDVIMCAGRKERDVSTRAGRKECDEYLCRQERV